MSSEGVRIRREAFLSMPRVRKGPLPAGGGFLEVSRNLPLKLSVTPFCQGLPGSMPPRVLARLLLAQQVGSWDQAFVVDSKSGALSS